jgi:predicted LPLAT superfamily acyltransferase
MSHHVDSELSSARGADWVARPERSNTDFIRFIVWVALALGRPAARALLYPTALYFLAFSSLARKASAGFMRRVLGRRPGVADSFRHFHSFAATILDRVFLLNDQHARFDVRVHGAEIVENMAARGEGCFLLGAHLGSFEIVRSLARATGGPRVSLVMYEENARKLTSVLHAINPKLSLEVIALGKLDSMLKVRAALERGGVVGMLGDRTLDGEGTMPCDFLGERATFPVGPLRIAAMLKQPVVLMFGLYRGGNRYDVHFERLADMKSIDLAQRDVLIEQSLRRYVARLEHYCRAAPYNWFNFYDFWK